MRGLSSKVSTRFNNPNQFISMEHRSVLGHNHSEKIHKAEEILPDFSDDDEGWVSQVLVSFLDFTWLIFWLKAYWPSYLECLISMILKIRIQMGGLISEKLLPGITSFLVKWRSIFYLIDVRNFFERKIPRILNQPYPWDGIGALWEKNWSIWL